MTNIATKLVFSNVNEGDEAPSLSHEIDRTDLVKYAGASGDFNPMHTNEAAAKKAELPSVFGHGMFTMGFLATAVTNWAGVGNLAEYGVRFTKQTWPGETLVTKIIVTAKGELDGRKTLTAKVSVANQDGEEKVSGTAIVFAG